MRRVLKALHEIGSAGIIGAIVAQIILVAKSAASHASGTAAAATEYAVVRRCIHEVSQYLLLPSLAIVLTTGLLAMAIHAPFHNAGWAWLKALFGVTMLEGTLGAIQGTARDAASLSQKIAAGDTTGEVALGLRDALRHEWGGLWAILTLSILNIVLAVWRPKLARWRRARSDGRS